MWVLFLMWGGGVEVGVICPFVRHFWTSLSPCLGVWQKGSLEQCLPVSFLWNGEKRKKTGSKKQKKEENGKKGRIRKRTNKKNWTINRSGDPLCETFPISCRGQFSIFWSFPAFLAFVPFSILCQPAWLATFKLGLTIASVIFILQGRCFWGTVTKHYLDGGNRALVIRL